MKNKYKKVALVHDWYSKRYYGGAEKTAQIIHNILSDKFETPSLFALFEDLSNKKNSWIYKKNISTSFIQKLPYSNIILHYYFPFFPIAIEQFDLSQYRLIISSSHLASKGVITSPEQLHISYVHTPMRYAWDQMNLYLKEYKISNSVFNPFIRLILHYMRSWDQLSGTRIDFIVANSNFTARRIKKYWGRDSKVIFPPVNTSKYNFDRERKDFYLSVCRLVPNKRVDLLVKAFNKLDLPLVIVGDGLEKNKLSKLASKNILILGFQDDLKVKELMETCRAFVYAGTEDFGVAPVEAMAAGAPVIGLDYAGLKDTVNCITKKHKMPTGLLFKEQNEQSIIDTIRWFEEGKIWKNFSSEIINKWARGFSVENFENKFYNFIEECISKHKYGM